MVGSAEGRRVRNGIVGNCALTLAVGEEKVENDITTKIIKMIGI